MAKSFSFCSIKKKTYLSCQLSNVESLDSFTTNLKAKLGGKKTPVMNSQVVDLSKHCRITALRK